LIDIYLITNLINGKQYVGKTQKGYLNRFNQHCLAYTHGCRNYISCAINKYGKDNFKIELITQVEDDTWEYWESYYIKKYKTHYSQGGYNITWGGDSNPMDIPCVIQKHKDACNTSEARKRYSEQAKQYNRSEKRKQVQKVFNEKYLTDPDWIYWNTRGLRAYNESRKIRVGMIENDQIIKEFDSLSDACSYLGVTNRSATAHIKRYADKINKNGKRAKFLGYSWTLL
jgi:group I intron endonuclease